MRTIVLILIAVALGGLRLALPADVLHGVWGQVFKDAAHLYVGGLVAAWLVSRKYRVGRPRLWGRLALGLSLLELAAFVVGREFRLSVLELAAFAAGAGR